MANRQQMKTDRSSHDDTLARMVVDRGLATNSEVDRCRAMANEANGDESDSQNSLASVLISQGVVTRSQIDRLRPQVDDRSDMEIPGFEILGRLGAGAMATVYKAKQVSLDRLVAIKILPSKQTRSPEFVDRFYKEGKAAAKLNHANIVQAIDVGKAGETHYFVMEYVEGRTVFDDLTEHGRYTEKRALEIAIQVVRALAHAHKAGFIHRDVKPKNIMLTTEGVAKLADMGLARAVSDREAAEAEQGKAFGTPYYISPEQIRGQLDVDFHADIYSLGATLYQMVTGQVPFDGPNPTAVMHKHLKADIKPPDHLNPELSAGISEVIEVCMATKPNERYNSTEDLLSDLQAVAAGEPPPHARRKFDLSSLTDLEKSAVDEDGEEALATQGPPSVLVQPLFWVALAGWLVAVLLGVLLIATALAGGE